MAQYGGSYMTVLGSKGTSFGKTVSIPLQTVDVDVGFSGIKRVVGWTTPMINN